MIRTKASLSCSGGAGKTRWFRRCIVLHAVVDCVLFGWSHCDPSARVLGLLGRNIAPLVLAEQFDCLLKCVKRFIGRNHAVLMRVGFTERALFPRLKGS